VYRKFQAKSYDIMKHLRQDFNYEKYKYTGETKDIAKLYLNFFITLRLEGKVNDLKKAYANNKFMGVGILFEPFTNLIPSTQLSRLC
jgi:hypothetical protein